MNSADLEQNRLPEDQITENFARDEIDRSIGQVSRDFLSEKQEPMIGCALDILRSQGNIAILDAGCGTGRALFELKDQLAYRTDTDSSEIEVVGINDQDFSQESEKLNVRKAIEKGEIKYRIEKIEDAQLDPEHFDIIYSYETIIHNQNPDKLFANLWGALKKNGRMYFNLDDRIDSDKEFNKYLDKLKSQGAQIFRYQKTNRFGQKRTFFEIIK